MSTDEPLLAERSGHVACSMSCQLAWQRNSTCEDAPMRAFKSRAFAPQLVHTLLTPPIARLIPSTPTTRDSLAPTPDPASNHQDLP